MHRLPMIAGLFVIAFVLITAAEFASAGDWPKFLDHPPAGANTIVLVNADTLKLGASKLKHFKNGEQKGAAENLVAELPEHMKRAGISAFIDFDSLEPVWEVATATLEKNKLPTPNGLAEQAGGYLDKIAGKPIVWSPRGRYIIPQGADRLSVYKPADRSGVARWIRSLTQPAQPLPDYLKKVAERTLDSSALVLAVETADSVSPVAARNKLATLQSQSAAGTDPDELAALVADLQGLTFSVSVEDQFMGQLQLDFGSTAGALNKGGKEIVLEVLSRRGILLPELRDWKAAVRGKSFVMEGPLDAGSVLNLISFLTSSPSSSDAAFSSPGNGESAASSAASKAAQASKRYFTSVQRILSQCRDTKGLSVAERGVFNDKLSRKIDDLPMLDVDRELLDYGANVAQLIRGAGLAIRSANVAAGGQKAVSASSYAWGGYYGGFAFNDNVAYNDSLTRQAHAEGMQNHIGNMQQVDNLTAEIRRKMVEKYGIEF